MHGGIFGNGNHNFKNMNPKQMGGLNMSLLRSFYHEGRDKRIMLKFEYFYLSSPM